MGKTTSFCFILSLWCVATSADTYTLVQPDSVFAVVTHKAGFAARLAHNHMIYPSTYTAEASVDPAHQDQAHFRLRFPVTALVVDDSAAKTRWYPGIQAAGILDEPFPEVSEKDRQSIGEHMLAKNQLDADKYPEISAELKGIRAKASTQGEKSFAYEATVALTVHGVTVERPFAANIEATGDAVHVEAASSFNFTDFGIKPYSAFLGAVRNENTFYVYVNLKAQRVNESQPAAPTKP